MLTDYPVVVDVVVRWGDVDSLGHVNNTLGCRFKAPVTYPDTLSVGARVAALGDDRVLMEHAAFSHKLDRLAAEGDAVVVSFDYVAGRRISLLPELRGAILALEKRDIPVYAPLTGFGRSGMRSS